MGTRCKTICKHQILFSSIQHLAWLPQERPQRKQKCGKIAIFGLTHWLKHRITRKLLNIDRYIMRGVIRTASAKNRYFYHIFVSPGDALGAITLNVVWVERAFDAYKLSRFMCPSNYNRFWDRVRYLWKNRYFIIPFAFNASVRGGFHRNIGIPFGTEKLEWCCYLMMKKFWRYVYSFWRDQRTWRTDTAWKQRPRLHRIAR